LVVNEKDEDAPEYNAALILNEYLFRMTGVDYTIYTFDELEFGYDKRCHYISIGKNSLLYYSPYKFFGGKAAEEYFWIKSDGNILFIDGTSDRAVLYGVYELLRALGAEFFTVDCEFIPTGVKIVEEDFDIVCEPDIAIRQYLAYQTCYSHTNEDFAVKSGVNSMYAHISGKAGGSVCFGYLGADTHNARFYVGEKYFGTEYCPKNENAVGGYVPCLTNGIDYNSGGVSTLTLVVNSMRKLIAENPSIKYFTFEQEDGKAGAYCTCGYCVAAAEKYGRSGVLMRFCNAMLKSLRSDETLSHRTFKIVTFAYEYTMEAPIGGVTVDRDLCVWYAGYSDMRYSLFDENQRPDYKNNLSEWKKLTEDENSGSLILWLYDASYNNYLTYFGTTMTAIDKIVDEVVDMHVEMLLVLGAYDADNIWHSEMRNYIWTRKMFNSELKAKDLRDRFIENYFGLQAAGYVKEYCDDYDGYYADNTSDYPVRHGNEYYSRVSVSEHLASLAKIETAISAVNDSDALDSDRKNAISARLYGIKASTMSSLLYYFDTYYQKASLAQKKKLCGGLTVTVEDAKAAYIAEFKDVCGKAGVTRCREGVDENNTVDDFLSNNVGKKV